MLFNSYVFLGLFLPATLAGFALACRAGRRAAVGWLVLASLTFYGLWNIAFLPVLLVSIAGNFAAARLILAAEEQARDALLALGIAANLAALGWYKYLATLLGVLNLALPFGDPMLPLGISFFTFTQIGYLLDCHAGLEQRRPVLDYALFVSFFPHLLAGPIVSGRKLLPAFADLATWRFSAENLTIGAGIFLIGLLKKTLLADPVSTLVAPGFTMPETLTLLAAWRSALAWSLQIYFDFSGYSDMAVGLARMFGVTFPFNFNAPYKARSVIEYWQRWHISLTRFLMTAVHAPLALAIVRYRGAGGLAAQRTPAGFLTMLVLPITVTMGLAGLWHGATVTYVAFGLVHAAFLIVNHAWRLWRPAGAKGTRSGAAVNLLLTYLCVLFGAVIFRAPSMAIAGGLFASMLGGHGLGLASDLRGLIDAAWLAGLYAIVWAAPTTAEIVSPTGWRPTLSWAAAAGAAATLGLLSIGGTSEFLYFQF